MNKPMRREFVLTGTSNEFVNFGDFCRETLRVLCQHGSKYFCKSSAESGTHEYLGKGLRIEGSSANYHTMKIHRNDRAKAKKRYDAMVKRQLAK